MDYQKIHSVLNTWIILPYLLVLLGGCGVNSPSEGEDMGAIDKKEYITDGHLSVCPQRPNCVCSEDPQEDHRIAPLSFSGPAPVAWQTLQEILQDMGGQVEQSDDSFIHLTFRSSLFRFIDDVCCRLDQENRSIHIRSASRVGYSDFGVNRKRMEELRKRFVQ